MNFEQYDKTRKEMLLSSPELKDGGETNLYAFLKTKHSDVLPEILPSLHKDAEYRCHITDVYLNFLNISPIWKPNVLITHGVRHSLSLIFKIWALEKRTALIPGDVYPVYQKIAEESGVNIRVFSQKNWMADHHKLCEDQEKVGVVLCHPIKPWSMGLVPNASLSKLLQNKNAEIILDSAYNIEASKNSYLLTQIKQGAQVACLSSLSKGWLIPNHAGFVMGEKSLIDKWRPTFVKEKIDKSKLRIAYQALTADAYRYTLVQTLVESYHHKGLQWLRSKTIPIVSAHQYFAVVPLNWHVLHEKHKILAIPPSVFGSQSQNESIISLLNLADS